MPRLTFAQLEQWGRERGLIVERKREFGGRYSVTDNTTFTEATGVTTLEELLQEMHSLLEGRKHQQSA